MHVAIEPYLASSERVDTRDIDWTLAAQVGLSDDEIFSLTYFADVENQSLRYLRMLLEMKIAYQPDVDMRFLGVAMNFNDVYQPTKRRNKGPAATGGATSANTSKG